MRTLEALELQARFPVPSRQVWEETAQAELKTTPLSKLTRRNLEGLEVHPLYTREDLQGRPTGMPWTGPAWEARAAAASEPSAPLVAVPLDLDESAAEVLRQGLAAGETAVDLHLGTVGLQACRTVLTGLEVPFFLSGAADPLAVLQALPEGSRVGALFCEPLGFLARRGYLERPLATHLDAAAEAVRRAAGSPDLAVLGVDAGIWHEGGADVGQQLGYALATAVELVREMVGRGLELQEVLDRVAFSFTLSPRLFPELARLRAVRRLWARVAGLLGGEAKTRVLARTGRLHRSAWDPYTNLVRSTLEAFVALSGGADALCLEPMDAAAGGGIRASRRHARNQALVLLEEGSLHRMIDPGAGSFYLETLTDEVSKLAWGHFQSVEKAGGMAAALRQGLPQEQTAATASRRLKALATGRGSLVGVSHYAVRAEPPMVTGEPEAPAVPAGAALTVPAVPARRLAAAFEDLRLRTWTLEQRRGRPVSVLMAPLGGSGLSRIRAQFCVTFLGAAGFRTESPVGFASVAEALEEARRLEADMLVLCAEDSEYSGLVAEVRALSQDRPLLAVAGLPAELDPSSVDVFIHKDADRVQTAGDILARLEAR